MIFQFQSILLFILYNNRYLINKIIVNKLNKNHILFSNNYSNDISNITEKVKTKFQLEIAGLDERFPSKKNDEKLEKDLLYIQGLFDKQKLLRTLEDKGISEINKLKLLEDRSIKAQNLHKYLDLDFNQENKKNKINLSEEYEDYIELNPPPILAPIEKENLAPIEKENLAPIVKEKMSPNSLQKSNYKEDDKYKEFYKNYDNYNE